MDSKITCWEEDGGWIGYLDEYPDYWTQGDTLDDLLAHLLDLYAEVTAGTIPGARKRRDLQMP